MSSIVVNKYARYKYTIEDEFEAGLALSGIQVKAIKGKFFNIRDSIVRVKKDEFWLMNLNFNNSLITHDIKLLLTKKEIEKIRLRMEQKKEYVIPLNVHLKGHLIKLQIGLGKHKKIYDKRDEIRKSDDLREIDREIKNNKY